MTDKKPTRYGRDTRATTLLPPPDVTRPAWRDDAACKGTPEWWWYAPHGDNDEHVVDEAQALCETCPVQVACLEHALVMEDDGFWAGTTPAERRLRRKRAGIRLRRAIEVPLVVGMPEAPPPTAFPDKNAAANDELWIERARQRAGPHRCPPHLGRSQ